MKKKLKSKYINFFFNNYYDYSNKNKLPEMKRNITNKSMNNKTYSQIEINKRILIKLNNKYILNQFNYYCKNSKKNNIKSLNDLSDEYFLNSKNYSRNKKINFQTSTNFNKKSKNNFLFSSKDNFYFKNNILNDEEEKIYDFRQKFTDVKDRIIQLKNEYKFYSIPKYIKDEISSQKIEKLFNKDYDLDLNSKYKPKIRTIARLKNHSFNEKYYLDYNETKTIGKKGFTNNKNLKKYKSNLNSIDNFNCNNNIEKINYFHPASTSDFKIKLENIFNDKYNYCKNCMKLTKNKKS